MLPTVNTTLKHSTAQVGIINPALNPQRGGDRVARGKYDDFGKRVSLILAALGWSDRECADRMRPFLPPEKQGLTHAAVHKWRKGFGIQEEYLQALAKALEVEPWELRYGDKNKQGGADVERIGPWILTRTRAYRADDIARLKA